MKSERLSNMELLRIIAMMSVVLVHLDGASIGLPTQTQLSQMLPRDVWRVCVEALTITGVNCFTLISGYFGIRASRRGLARFVGMCLFYSVTIFLLSTLIKPGSFSWNALIDSLRIFTRNDLWYVPAYLLLYVLSPMLNTACETLSTRRLTVWTGAFVVLNVWGGWANGMAFNPTGYTPVQLVMVYLTGRTLARFQQQLLTRHWLNIASLALFVTSTAVTFFSAFRLPSSLAFAYNSPWVLAQSVSLFTLFATLNFTSHFINTLAKGAFATYLIHKNPFVWNEFIRPTALHEWRNNGLLFYSFFILAFSSLVYAFCTGIELTRLYLIRKFLSLKVFITSRH